MLRDSLRDGVGVLLGLAVGGVVCVATHWYRGQSDDAGRLTRQDSDRIAASYLRVVAENERLRAEVRLMGAAPDPLDLDAARRAAPRLGDAPEDRIPPQNVPTGN